MNTNNYSTNNLTSITMNLENLQQKHSNLLIQYKQALTDYINYLNVEAQQTNPDVKPPITSISGMSYIGTGSAGQSTATTLQECEADCYTSSSCTGATFVSGNCNLRIGDSPIIPASNDSYAIIPKGKLLLMNMNDLNNQLLAVNTEITHKITSSQPVYNEVESENNKQTQELIENYKELEIERENIIKLLEEYDTLDTTENVTQIKITQNYNTYILLVILAIAVVVLTIKISSSGLSVGQTIQSGGHFKASTYYILFAIILLVVGINFVIKNSLY